MADADQQPQRSSGSSARPSGSRSRQNNPQQQLSTIEKSVTHLLVATKQLLETLTQWSRGTASEGEVSDVYVRLGYEFNIACRAFSAIGVETADLGPVPDLLRTILEDTLSQEASQASLDKYLPRIRDIIINLLHGLKRKQQRLRQKDGAREPSDTTLPRQASVASTTGSRDSSLTQQLEDFPKRSASTRPSDQAGGSSSMPELPPRTTSVVSGRQSPRRANLSPQNSISQSASRDTLVSEGSSSSSNHALPGLPNSAPQLDTGTIPTSTSGDFEARDAPRPPPKQNDALSALQRGGNLERRASRRFSAYQIQKHLGASMNSMTTIPPAQNSPIPNRGRDARESMTAVRSRGNTYTRARSKGQTPGQDSSPSRVPDVRRISEADETDDGSKLDPRIARLGDQPGSIDSPIVKTPEDKLGSYPFPPFSQSPDKATATIKGPLSDHFVPESQDSTPRLQRQKSVTPARSTSQRARARTPPPTQFVPENSPQSGKELTLFLQYKSKIKKFVLPDGGDLSIPRLQLAFIEKFAWNTHNNGVDLPEIYIQDPVSGVRHELEDLADIKERSVLVLNVEALDEVKRHIDDGLGGLRRVVEGIRTSMESQQAALQSVSDRQHEAAREMASLAASPPQVAAPSPTSGARVVSGKDKVVQLSELQSLRRDLAVVRQTYASLAADMNSSMAAIRTKATTLQHAAKDVAAPALDPNSGRGYVDKGKKQLSEDSEKIVNRVDDLQDVVEDLRKDVVTRGVRPLPRQLETVGRDIATAAADLKKLQEFLKREKPVWTKIWERELQVVCDDRDLLTLQEELAVDLEDDLDKAAATFALVEQATKQQTLHQPEGTGGPQPGVTFNGAAVAGRSASRTLALDQGADPRKAKDSVLGEVRALQPNHESRLEAIERAERARARELDDRKGGDFQRELGAFVDEGRLKKTGGVEEVERVRRAREDSARREVLERQAQRMRERNEKEAAAAAAAAAPATAATAAPGAPQPAEPISSATADSPADAEAASQQDAPSDPAPSAPVDEPKSSSAGASESGSAPRLTLDLPPPAPFDLERESSPEPGFVDASETVLPSPAANQSDSPPAGL